MNEPILKPAYVITDDGARFCAECAPKDAIPVYDANLAPVSARCAECRVALNPSER